MSTAGTFNLAGEVNVVPATSFGADLHPSRSVLGLRQCAARRDAHCAVGQCSGDAASVKGIEMYRVRLGPLMSVEQADLLLARIVDSGYRKARIIIDLP